MRSQLRRRLLVLLVLAVDGVSLGAHALLLPVSLPSSLPCALNPNVPPRYLDESSRRPLLAVVHAQLVTAHVPALLAKGFDALMDARLDDELGALFTLCGRPGVEEIGALRAALAAHVKRVGLVLINDEEHDKDMVCCAPASTHPAVALSVVALLVRG